jgi:hypothetical protein
MCLRHVVLTQIWSDGKKKSSLCPRCGQDETSSHVWTCQQEDAIKLWSSEVKLLRLWLLNNGTSFDIQEALCDSLMQWHSGEEINVPTSNCVVDQTVLSWGMLIERRLSKTWGVTQQAHYEVMGSRRGGLTWASALTIRVWNIAWKMWEQHNHFEHQMATG